MTESSGYIEPTQNSGMKLVRRNIKGSIFMLNLLRFRKIADYTSHPELAPNQTSHPELAPNQTISGEEAFQCYIQHTLPFL
ncbi:hypothetical protein [Paenibacillus xylanexedens]|uniref:hypothetical protein n=1 Tax=Paenibacillus xylanexedens TaxID=528191 RepID=UPI001FD030E1|nr:hypothetical protein [Paenibacillus xylanexedens]